MKRVVVTIDRLVLKGFRYEDRHAIARGLQEQLAQLLSEPGMAERIDAIGSTSRLRLGTVRMSGDMQGQQIGQATGRAIAAHWFGDSREKIPAASDRETDRGPRHE